MSYVVLVPDAKQGLDGLRQLFCRIRRFRHQNDKYRNQNRTFYLLLSMTICLQLQLDGRARSRTRRQGKRNLL